MTAENKKLPVLSIIVPVLNEAKALPGFLSMLGEQTGLTFEVILSDGGSTDSSREEFPSLKSACTFACRWLDAPRGRAVQMNRGAAAARGRFLLFLHIDSRLLQTDALCSGVNTMLEAEDGLMAAGHFHLVFGDAPPELLKKMRYWEIKARLDRPGCTHGDQGMLLERSVFEASGRFPEDLAIFEDTMLAESIRKHGQWLLLPATIQTSARRFASEGLRQRQLLNALLSNFKDIGWADYFSSATTIYRQQRETGPLVLGPFLQQILSMLAKMSLLERLRFLYATGRFVRRNAWQLLLAQKIRGGRWNKATPSKHIEKTLLVFDRWFDLLTCNSVGFALTGFLTWIWFRLQVIREKPSDESAKP